MTANPKPDVTARPPLSRERVLRAAIELADAAGLDALSMRKLGRKLGVEAMSLYNHVANKDDLLDGMIDEVVAEIELPTAGEDWKAAMRRRAVSARAAFARHPWAIVLESRADPGPVRARYYDAVLGCLRGSGFSAAMAAHAFSLLDSYLYGFTLQETSMPFASAEELAEVGIDLQQNLPVDDLPHLAEMIGHVLTTGYDYADEFAFGLELILDGLERMRTRG